MNFNKTIDAVPTYPDNKKEGSAHDLKVRLEEVSKASPRSIPIVGLSIFYNEAVTVIDRLQRQADSGQVLKDEIFNISSELSSQIDRFESDIKALMGDSNPPQYVTILINGLRDIVDSLEDAATKYTGLIAEYQPEAKLYRNLNIPPESKEPLPKGLKIR